MTALKTIVYVFLVAVLSLTLAALFGSLALFVAWAMFR